MHWIVLASLFVLAAGPALAQGSPAQGSLAQLDPVTAMVRLDADHDGGASRAEWAASGERGADFAAVDADKDGRITVAELRAWRRAHATSPAELAALKAETPKFEAEITVRLADADRDGGVSEAEWVAYGGHGGRGFTPIDADHDGKITAAELAAFREAHKPR